MVTTIPETATRTTWAIDPAHTLVEFSAKHMMISTVKGRFTEVEGAIRGDLSEPQNAAVDITIGAASIDSRNDQRDAHLRSVDFLDAENFPTLQFVSKAIVPRGDNEYRVIGDLTLRGVTREVTLDATLEGTAKSPWGTEVVGISASGKINRSDFGLTWNVVLETGGVVVSDAVKIAIELEAVKQ